MTVTSNEPRVPAPSTFVHLRVHSEYSLVDSVVRIKQLLEGTQRHGMPAIAVTDEANLSAMVKFQKAALAHGIKPIIGADVWLGENESDCDPSRFTLLCTNLQGFGNLSRLLTQAHQRADAPHPGTLLKEWLDAASLGGLIALSGAQNGEIGRALSSGRGERARELTDEWQARMPGRFYLELQRLGRSGEADYVQAAVALAAQSGMPVVATNEVCFIERDDFGAHETRVCIGQGRTLDDPARPRLHTEEQFLKSAADMQERFADLPEALANTLAIATRCNLELQLGKFFLPEFAAPKGQGTQQYLRDLAASGLAERLGKVQSRDDQKRHATHAQGKSPNVDASDGPTAAAGGQAMGARITCATAGPSGDAVAEQRLAPVAQYDARLERELDVICQMGFDGYFLIVADFIAWARRNAIPVGPGRGSGAGSLVAFALGITDLDPIEHDLLFERFLNPERVSMPDFDIDFCIEGRDRVIGYVAERYGRDRVSQIVTFGTMAARAVVRDVGRVFGMPYGYVDRIAKLIPFEIGMTLERALAESDELKTVYESEDEVRDLINMARRLEGLARNTGTHAGGVVIAPAPLTEFMPLYSDPGAGLLSQLDKDDLEAVGLVKFDFLGLKTLTVVDKALAIINGQRAAQGLDAIDVNTLPMDDAKTYELLNRCDTTAVFQLESRGMRDLIKKLRPDCFGDLVAIVALFRPGPMQMADDFIERKHASGARLDYLHPSLEPILKSTYGVILYQEQVMQIAQVLAGYSLGGADLLRRAMGKKKLEEMAKQRSVFVAGAVERGVEEARATHIFDLMEKFAGYGFNKSHAAAYALVSYQTAWLKAHYTAAFMAAVMTADMDFTDKLVVLKDDCKHMGLEIRPPDVNRSAHPFTVASQRCIHYGLGAIKGVGQGVVEAIVNERDAGGPYESLLDLCRRVDGQKLNRRVLEALTRAGALDALGANRATLMNSIPDALQLAERSARALAVGQGALFCEDSGVTLEHEFEVVRSWTKHERLEAERDSLGLYLTGHPFDDFAAHCGYFTNGPIAGIVESLPPDGANVYRFRREVTVAGVVMDMRRRGGRFSLTLDDNTDRIEVSLFDDVYATAKQFMVKHAVLVVRGQLRFDDFLGAWRVTAQRISSVDDEIETHARRLTINWPCGDGQEDFVEALKGILESFTPGECEVSLRYQGQAAGAMLTLGDAWRVRLARDLRAGLTRLLGEEQFSIHYPKHFV